MITPPADAVKVCAKLRARYAGLYTTRATLTLEPTKQTSINASTAYVVNACSIVMGEVSRWMSSYYAPCSRLSLMPPPDTPDKAAASPPPRARWADDAPADDAPADAPADAEAVAAAVAAWVPSAPPRKRNHRISRKDTSPPEPRAIVVGFDVKTPRRSHESGRGHHVRRAGSSGDIMGLGGPGRPLGCVGVLRWNNAVGREGYFIS